MSEVPAVSVIGRLQAVMRDLPAIAKVKHPSADGKGVTYAYRGIEEITAEVQGLFALHGIVVVPKVRHREVVDIVVNERPWTDTYLEVDWKIYGQDPGDWVEATTFGHGRDNSDKGTNKAMTQAFKYLLLDMLCISDPADDNDGTNVAADARRVSAPRQQPTHEEINGEQIPLDVPMQTTRSGPPSDLPSPKQLNYAKALLNQAGIGDGDAFEEWFRVNLHGTWPGSLNNISKAQCSHLIELLK